MSCIQDAYTEFETHLKNIRCLSEKDNQILKEKIPWLYDLLNGLPVKRPIYDISKYIPYAKETSLTPSKRPIIEKPKGYLEGIRHYICWDGDNKMSYVMDVHPDGSETFSHWEMPPFGRTIEWWCPGIKKYTI